MVEPVLHAEYKELFTDEGAATRSFLVNPTGKFEIGGPMGDAGLTGRKIIVDTYGGAARHGGGAFSGKDPSKVDRSAAYAARYVAKNVVAAGLADRCEVQVAYAIGVAHPVSLMVQTFGTGKLSDAEIARIVERGLRPAPGGLPRYLDLHRPIFQKTAAYGHFGRTDHDFTWERTDRVDELRRAAGLEDAVPAPSARLTRTALSHRSPRGGARGCAALVAGGGVAGGVGRAGAERARSTAHALFVTGRLADFDHRPLRVRASRGRGSSRPSAAPAARGSGGSGLRRRQAGRAGLAACGSSCPSSATLQFTYSRHRFGDGHHRVVIEATDGRARWLARGSHVEPVPARALRGAPTPLPAFYLTAPDRRRASQPGLHGRRELRPPPDGGRGLLVLDFGAARLHRGTLRRAAARRHVLQRRRVHGALQAAAPRLSTTTTRAARSTIVYTTSNALLGAGGNGDRRSPPDGPRGRPPPGARVARPPSLPAHLGRGWRRHRARLRPDRPARGERALVAGAVSVRAGAPVYDVGTAPCDGDAAERVDDRRTSVRSRAARAAGPCPRSTTGPPLDQAEDWRAAAVACNIDAFAGVSGSALADYTPPQSWRRLRASTNAERQARAGGVPAVTPSRRQRLMLAGLAAVAGAGLAACGGGTGASIGAGRALAGARRAGTGHAIPGQIDPKPQGFFPPAVLRPAELLADIRSEPLRRGRRGNPRRVPRGRGRRNIPRQGRRLEAEGDSPEGSRLRAAADRQRPARGQGGGEGRRAERRDPLRGRARRPWARFVCGTTRSRSAPERRRRLSGRRLSGRRRGVRWVARVAEPLGDPAAPAWVARSTCWTTSSGLATPANVKP